MEKSILKLYEELDKEKCEDSTTDINLRRSLKIRQFVEKAFYDKANELNNIKEMFIDQVHAVMKVCKLDKGRIRYKGNMLKIEQDLQLVINKLPLIPPNAAKNLLQSTR